MPGHFPVGLPYRRKCISEKKPKHHLHVPDCYQRKTRKDAPLGYNSFQDIHDFFEEKGKNLSQTIRASQGSTSEQVVNFEARTVTQPFSKFKTLLRYETTELLGMKLMIHGE